MTELNDILNKGNNNRKGLCNELLIMGNSGYNGKVLNNNSPYADIEFINNERKTNFIECKLDLLSKTTSNLYYEIYNLDNSRITGILAPDMTTLYSHTFYYGGKWCFIIAERQEIAETLRMIYKKEPDKIKPHIKKPYNYVGKDRGDIAYIVDKETFIRYYKGEIKPLKLSLMWEKL